MTRVLVTGAEGFIGSELVRQIRERDRAWHRQTELLALGSPPDDELRSWETLDRIAAFDPHVVFHLAAVHFIPYCNAHPDETLEVNALATDALIRTVSADTFVLASSAAVYGLTPGPTLRNEGQPRTPVDVYGLSKVWAEDALRLAAGPGRNFVAARLFNVVGQYDRTPHLVPLIMFAAKHRETAHLDARTLDHQRDYVHVRDVARVLLELADLPATGYRVVNVATEIGHSVSDVARAFGVRIEDNPSARRPTGGHLIGSAARLRDLIGFAPGDPFERLLEGI